LCGVAASDAGARPTAAPKAPAGTVLGGLTSQDWPVVLELNRRGTQVVRVVLGLRLTCSSGGVMRIPDGFIKLAVAGNGKFAASFGPQTQRNPDGTTSDFQSSMTGKLDRGRTKASGTWQFTATDYDAAGAVSDTCASGPVKWSAKN
jgi:hypothetical protein